MDYAIDQSMQMASLHITRCAALLKFSVYKIETVTVIQFSNDTCSIAEVLFQKVENTLEA